MCNRLAGFKPSEEVDNQMFEQKGRYLFTSESVTEGHPDKMADQISDAVLDAILAHDPRARVACETLLTTGLVIVAGEITTNGVRRHPRRSCATRSREIGYTDAQVRLRRHDLRA